MSMETDEKLMQRVRDFGDAGAYSELYERYHKRVYSYLTKRVPHSEREDLFQRCFMHLYEKRELYQTQPFAPWFFVMMKHLLIDEYRKSGRSLKLSHEEIGNLALTDTEDATDVEELLAKLPQETAQLVREHYLSGHSYDELAKKWQLSAPTIRQRLSRALRSLRGAS